MRKGIAWSKWLQSGSGDDSPTGRALAWAEWSELRERMKLEEAGAIRAGLPLGQQKDGTFATLSDDMLNEGGVDLYPSKAAYEAAIEERYYREQWEQGPFHELMSLEEFILFQQVRKTISHNPKAKSIAIQNQQVKFLLDAFLEELKAERDTFTSSLNDGNGISKKRFETYSSCIRHIRISIGDEVVNPVADFILTDSSLSSLLLKYRNLCKREVAERSERNESGRSAYWFNEQMKTIRRFSQFLMAKGMINALPSNLDALTRKATIEVEPTPIPLNILREAWTKADAEMRLFLLLGLNCGMRQGEIDSLHSHHLVTIAGTATITKKRSKTKQPLCIPLWESTRTSLEAHRNDSGKLLNLGNDAVAYIGKRFDRLMLATGIEEAKSFTFSSLRDFGASFVASQNPMLVPHYLAHAVHGAAKHYVASVRDDKGNLVVPLTLKACLEALEAFLSLD